MLLHSKLETGYFFFKKGMQMFDSNHFVRPSKKKNLVVSDLREDSGGCELVAAVLFVAQLPRSPCFSLKYLLAEARC